ncbi:MAG: pyruvate formate-lyase-activating protein [Bacillota bacterium]
MKGNIHSFETMGLFDGPGIRTVIFFQGCPLRCSYCHNPDTWTTNTNNKFSVNEVVEKVLEYKNYYDVSNGGVTFSGGEPLLQTKFLIKVAKKLKKHDIHIALDTSGIGKGDFDELLKYIDLVLLDIKHPTKKGFFEITKRDNSSLLHFIDYLNKSNTSVWIRNVIVNNINDSKKYIDKLKKFINQIKNVEKIELLPFHKMGEEKYSNLDLNFPLKDTAETTEATINKLENYIKIAK